MDLVVRAFVLVLAGALAGLASNSVRRDGLLVSAFEAPSTCEAAEAAGQPLQIAPAEASAMCGQPGVVVADARTATAFAEGHVAEAIHLPCDASGRVAADAIERLEGARTVIVYGDGTADALPVAAGLRRRAHHPSDVRVLTGGFAAWEKAGLACVSGPCEECKLKEAHSP